MMQQNQLEPSDVAPYDPSYHEVTKKVRHREEQPLDEGGDLEILGDGTSKLISFRDVVLNKGSKNNVVGDEWEVDDFDFQKADVRKGVFD
ncbi:hypothetical protein Gotri_015031 [Gossypium trilobum]|uniref:Uncharacterized protein n=1 Tax=Gossypium trilobum TaxID=34281 RepID=A0A7J9DYX3_9ROSI|nr:hypothetical protein [Gossypium trilobum]